MQSLAEMLETASEAVKDVEIGSTEGFSPIPAGTYNVVVANAEGPIESKRANPLNPQQFGTRINLTLSILDGQYANRKLFLNNNILAYPKTMSDEDKIRAQKCMAIGARERKVFLDSLGKTSVQDVHEFIGATAKVEVIIGKDMNGNPRNEIKKVFCANASTPVAQATAPSPAQAPQTPAKPKMPWEK